MLLTTVNIACNKKSTNSPITCVGCENPLLFTKDFGLIDGTVQKVNQYDYVYNSNLYYILVSATSFVKYTSSTEKTLNIFICDPSLDLSKYYQKKIKIAGTLNTCLTGNHGRLTNNLYTFNIAHPVTIIEQQY